jgi:two-component system sensor histidine kinase/response regulator
LAIVEETFSLLEGEAVNKRISFHQIIEDHVFINADENMMKTVLRNLVSNAIKFTMREVL